MGTAIAAAWGVVLFIIGLIVAVALLGILALLVAYAVKSIREGLRAGRENDAAVERLKSGTTTVSQERAGLPVLPTGNGAPGGAYTPPRLVPPPSNVTSIMRHEDQ